MQQADEKKLAPRFARLCGINTIEVPRENERINLDHRGMKNCMSTAKAEVTVQNDAGMHLRPAAAFVHTANKHKGCEILVSSGTQRVNGKSIMGLVMLAASKGTHLTIECVGEGSEAALKELVDLVTDRFGTEN